MNDAGKRIDQFLANNEKDISRTRIKSLILEGSLKLDNNIIYDPSYKIKENDVFTLFIPEAKDPTPKGEDIKLKIVFEDENLIVIDKPKGLVVHPAPGNQRYIIGGIFFYNFPVCNSYLSSRFFIIINCYFFSIFY